LKNKQDAEDVFQDVFLKYLDKRPDFADEGHERAWFLRVTINLCKSFWRGPWQKTVALGEREPAARTDSGIELLDAVFRLSPKLRAVVHLYYYEGYSTREVAQMLGIRETAVQTRLAGARKKLAQTLAEEDFAYGKE
jgi:RNA polymerase sigma-70 factor (ECF subfamily)